MENISKNDINFRLDKIKNKATEINNKIEKNDEELATRYNFAKDIGINIDILNTTTEEVKQGLNMYIKKVDNILERYKNNDNNDYMEEYKLLNNMLYLDDIKLKNVSELVNEDKDIKTRKYINIIATKANDLIRQEEIKSLDLKINKYSKINFIEKITGKAKIKKAMLENYSLKRVETVNKKYIPENKSLYEIVSIVNNCGYKSKEIDTFIDSIVNEFKFDKPTSQALVFSDNNKIPLFHSKEFLNKINAQNAEMLDRINNKNNNTNKISNDEKYDDLLKNDISTLELFNFNNIIEEVI